MANVSGHTDWFGHCHTLAEVKAEYRRLCFMYHPDHGGDSEVMQHINQAYRLALRSRPEAGVPSFSTHVGQRQRHWSPPPSPPKGQPPLEWSRDSLRRVWNASLWRQVANKQFERTIGMHVVTVVQWMTGHETMWAVRAGEEFSKYAFATRAEAEEEGFNLLYHQLQMPGG